MRAQFIIVIIWAKLAFLGPPMTFKNGHLFAIIFAFKNVLKYLFL